MTPGEDPGPIVKLDGVTKRFGNAVAVADLTLEIAAGEFFSILGPSGCGKTTTLRMLGGFEVPDRGTVMLAGRDVTRVPPYKRDVNTVFQSYGLFDHLNVSDNVAFGLKRRRVATSEIARRVGQMLELVNLSDRAKARPRELSGGQQQRVALARALVNMPAVLLLDEPLGALDLKLRRGMQIELKNIQREVGITFVFVTHDQEEALMMSDRIGVMNSAVLQQVGSPAEIYDRPVNPFVAGFIGASNIMRGEIRSGRVRLAEGITMPLSGGLGTGFRDGDAVIVSVRPEKLLLGSGATQDSDVRLPCRVVDVVYLGATTHITLTCGGALRLLALSFHGGGSNGTPVRPGDDIGVSWEPEDALVLKDDPAAEPPRPGAVELSGGE